MNQGLYQTLVWFVAFFGIIYFLIIRPNSKQQKQRKAMLESLKVKDKVVTIGGIHGTVTKIKDDTVILKVSPSVEMEFLRAAIQTILNRQVEEPAKGKRFTLKKQEKVEESNVIDAESETSEN